MTEQKSQSGNKIYKICRLLKYAVFAFIWIIFVISLAVYVYASYNRLFAEVYSNTVSRFIRSILATLTGFLPFSLTETIVVVGVPAIILLFLRAMVLWLYYGDTKKVKCFIKTSVYLILILSSVFINSFGVCYKRFPVSYLMDIECEEITTEDVFISAHIAASIASKFCTDAVRLSDGSTSMPYSFDEMVEKIHNGYRNILSDVQETLSVKPVALSKPWTYTRISGMYFPFTGESNINMNFPDFSLAFTTAHEIAHQFGFADEQDANMLAFLALSYSDDSYLIYSAYLSVYDYLVSDLKTDEASLIIANTDRRLVHELSAYYSHLENYRNDVIADISSEINDSYLKANGVEEGTKSYGKVTFLICNFMKSVYPEFYR